MGSRLSSPKRGRPEQCRLLVQPRRQARLPRTTRCGVAEHRNSFAEIVTAAVTIRVHKQLSLLVESKKRAEQNPKKMQALLTAQARNRKRATFVKAFTNAGKPCRAAATEGGLFFSRQSAEGCRT